MSNETAIVKTGGKLCRVKQRIATAAFVIGVMALCGCHKSLPKAVDAEEYSVYTAYLQHYAATGKHGDLQVVRRTFPANVLFGRYIPANECIRASNGLLKPLLALGDAEFPLGLRGELSAGGTLPVRVVSEDWNAVQLAATNDYDTIRYTRVAFSRDKTEAFFGLMNEPCSMIDFHGKRQAECGGGSTHFVRAYRSGNSWTFKSVDGCPVEIE